VKLVCIVVVMVGGTAARPSRRQSYFVKVGVSHLHVTVTY